MSELRSCVVEAMIRGYHEYQSIWEAEVGENLTCIREPGNVRDPYVPRSRCREAKRVTRRRLLARDVTDVDSAGLLCVVSLILRYKISRIHPDPRKQQKLIPSKMSRYTV